MNLQGIVPDAYDRANIKGGKLSICSIHSIEIDNVWEQCLDEVVRAPCPNVNGVMLLVSCYDIYVM